MDNHDKFREIARHCESHRVDAEENYRRQCKRRLKKIIETKLNTTMIGALSAIEQHLGRLWGQDKSPDALTEREKQFLAIWSELRTDILNNGNAQKRAALAEIDEYDVSWQQYHFDLHVQERQRHGEDDER